MPEESDASSTSKLTVITDQDHHPVTVDHNPAHFDGFLAEIADFARRSGKFLELLEHGITFRGAKTVVDSVSAIPFIQGKVTGAKFYSAYDPCAHRPHSASLTITKLLPPRIARDRPLRA